MKKGIVTLTNSESKRLIAKGLASLPEVQRAYSHGILGLPLCTSNAYVYEELTGRTLEDRSSYCCGYIFGKGLCINNFADTHPEIVFVSGQEERLSFPEQSLFTFIGKMGAEDVIVKSGNLLDINKKAALLSSEPNGGEYGSIFPYILAKGISMIVPMTLNKSAPVVIEDIIAEAGIGKISSDVSLSMACGVFPMPGKVITEIEALQLLAGVKALPLAVNGIGSGEGSVTLLFSGGEEEVMVAWNLISSIKGEPRLVPKSRHCRDCTSFALGVQCPIGAKINRKTTD